MLRRDARTKFKANLMLVRGERNNYLKKREKINGIYCSRFIA